MTPEGKVKAAVKKRLSQAGIWYYMPVQNGMGVVGIPDFVGCLPITVTPDMVGKTLGVFVGIETKAPGKISNTTPNQERVLGEIAKHGGVVSVVDDAAQLDRVLDGHR